MYNEEKELIESNKEKEIFNKQIEVSKYILEDSIIRKGLGKEIKETLRNPIKVSRMYLIKYKIKKFFSNLIEIL